MFQAEKLPSAKDKDGRDLVILKDHLAWKTGMEEAQGLEETEEIQIIDQGWRIWVTAEPDFFIGNISLADVS